MPFEIYSDHESLKYLHTQKDLSGKLLRWLDFIQMFDFGDIKYLPGDKNPVGDALSRPPIREVAALHCIPSTDQALPDEAKCFSVSLTLDVSAISYSMPVHTLRTRIQQELATCPQFGPIFKTVKDPTFDPHTHKWRDKYIIQDDLLYWNIDSHKRICVPVSIRPDLLHEFHDSPISGHVGIDKTRAMLSREYYWRRMDKDIIAYINSCDTCQHSKPTNLAPAGLARALPIPVSPGRVYGLDFITGLPPDKQGRNCLVVFVDHCSRLLCLIPAVSSTDPRDADNPLNAAAVARIYIDHVFKRFGLCEALVSDRDSRFVSDFWQELHKMLGTKLYMSTAYHPQSDGLTERHNRTLVECLRCILMDRGGAWTDFLSVVEFALNNSQQDATGTTPFFLTHGQHPRVPATIDASAATNADVADVLERIEANLRRARDMIASTQMRMTAQLDTTRRVSPFAVGDMVYLSTRNLTLDSDVARKFDSRFDGPFKILSLHGHGNAAVLDLPHKYVSRGIHTTFNVGLLKKCTPRPTHLGPARITQPPPSMLADNGAPMYDVDYIVRQALRGRGANKRLYVLVRWKGYAPKDDTWEPYDILQSDCPAAVTTFEASRRTPLPRPQRAARR